MKKIHLLILFNVFLNQTLFSQFVTPTNEVRQYTTNFNGWYMYIGDHKVSKKWGVHLEAQFRRFDLLPKNQQLLLRTGLNYYFDPLTFATLGYCFVKTYPYGEFAVKTDFPEHRIWQQIQFKSQLGKIEVVNRYRLEQRFMFLPELNKTTQSYEVSNKATYQNRMRLMTRLSIPLKGKTIEDKRFFVSVYDEVFLNFGKNVGLNYIDQNRAYIALGYKLPKLGRLEIGYLNQLVVKPDGLKVENNHTLQLGMISNINFQKR